MIEIGLGIAACVIMSKIASADDESPILWGVVTFGLCCLSVFIPLPFLRILIAWGASFALMIVVKMRRDDGAMKKRKR